MTQEHGDHSDNQDKTPKGFVHRISRFVETSTAAGVHLVGYAFGLRGRNPETKEEVELFNDALHEDPFGLVRGIELGQKRRNELSETKKE